MSGREHDAEWRREENWRGGALGIYVAPRDPRVWVPERIGPGWTLDFAHRVSWAWLTLLLGAPLAIVAAHHRLDR